MGREVGTEPDICILCFVARASLAFWRLRDFRDSFQNTVRAPADLTLVARAMKHFELRFLDSNGRPGIIRAYICDNDRDAIAEAERLSGDHTIELWQGSRMVVRINRRN